MRGIAEEFLARPYREPARARQIHLDHVGDAPRTRREHNHPVAKEDRLGDAVRDEYDRLLFRQPHFLQLDVHLVARERIQGAERLVHEQQHRIVDQRAANRDALAHAPRQLRGIAVLEPREAGECEQAAGMLFRLSPVAMAEIDRQHEVVHDAAPFEQRVALEHHAQALGRVAHLGAVDHDRTRGGDLEARDASQQRALAAAARAEHAHELAWRNRERDLFEGGDAGPGEVLAHPADLDRGGRPCVHAAARRGRIMRLISTKFSSPAPDRSFPWRKSPRPCRPG